MLSQDDNLFNHEFVASRHEQPRFLMPSFISPAAACETCQVWGIRCMSG